MNILYMVSHTVTGSMVMVKIGSDLGQSPETLVPCIIGTIINMAFSFFLSFNMIFFILTWIEEFGNFCTNFYIVDVESHVRKCLDIFESLQKGLGKFHQF